MTVAQSLIQFGGYIMPIGTKLDSREIDSTIENAPMLGMDGEFAPPGLSLGAIVSLTIDVGGGGDVSPTTNSPLITLDDLNDEANQLFAHLQKGYQNLTLGTTPARYLLAQKRKASAKYTPGSFRSNAEMTLEFYAPDPRMLSVALNALVFTANQQQTVTNAGTARTYPKFTLTGMTQSPKVGIGLSAGAMQVSIALSYTPILTDVIVIDCDPRNRANAVLLNGVARLDLLGTSGIINTIGTADMFPFLEPGVSYVWFGEGNDTAGTLNWRDAWML